MRAQLQHPPRRHSHGGTNSTAAGYSYADYIAGLTAEGLAGQNRVTVRIPQPRGTSNNSSRQRPRSAGNSHNMQDDSTTNSSSPFTAVVANYEQEAVVVGRSRQRRRRPGVRGTAATAEGTEGLDGGIDADGFPVLSLDQLEQITGVGPAGPSLQRRQQGIGIRSCQM